MSANSCDCIAVCGDDLRVRKGTVNGCPHYRLWLNRAHIRGVRRDATDPLALVVLYDRPPDDDDLRALHNFDRWPHI